MSFIEVLNGIDELIGSGGPQHGPGPGEVGLSWKLLKYPA
jgi:hypothetical protein